MSEQWSWHSQAWCGLVRGLPWIAEPENVSAAERVAMTAVCAGCPVVFECADYVAGEGITSGFWCGSDRTPADELSVGGAA